MQLTVQGKQIDLGDALRAHVEERIEDLNQKYFNHATFASVTFSREGHGHGLIKTHISISVGKSIMVMADAVEGDAYLSFDTANAKVAAQLRRYKNRLRDHHERMERDLTPEYTAARDVVLASDREEEDSFKGDDPLTIAEIATEIHTMSVSEAVMRMDLAGQNALLFRNAKNNELNMVYRRSDGHIGWVDPSGCASAKKEACDTAKKVRRA